jgi:hypothetical protein
MTRRHRIARTPRAAWFALALLAGSGCAVSRAANELMASPAGGLPLRVTYCGALDAESNRRRVKILCGAAMRVFDGSMPGARGVSLQIAEDAGVGLEPSFVAVAGFGFVPALLGVPTHAVDQSVMVALDDGEIGGAGYGLGTRRVVTMYHGRNSRRALGEALATAMRVAEERLAATDLARDVERCEPGIERVFEHGRRSWAEPTDEDDEAFGRLRGTAKAARREAADLVETAAAAEDAAIREQLRTLWTARCQARRSGLEEAMRLLAVRDFAGASVEFERAARRLPPEQRGEGLRWLMSAVRYATHAGDFERARVLASELAASGDPEIVREAAALVPDDGAAEASAPTESDAPSAGDEGAGTVAAEAGLEGAEAETPVAPAASTTEGQ